jgi:hypothetical protein
MEPIGVKRARNDEDNQPAPPPPSPTSPPSDDDMLTLGIKCDIFAVLRSIKDVVQENDSNPSVLDKILELVNKCSD